MAVLTLTFAAARFEDGRESDNLEARWLALARGGDLDAFEEIVGLHEQRVFALALRLTGSAEDAKDATQETFIRLHRHIAQIDSSRSVGPWLYTVAVNACRDIGRARQRPRLVSLDLPAAKAQPDPAATPERLYSHREQERQFRAVIGRLPERERAALLLCEMEGFSTE